MRIISSSRLHLVGAPRDTTSSQEQGVRPSDHASGTPTRWGSSTEATVSEVEPSQNSSEPAFCLVQMSYTECCDSLYQAYLKFLRGLVPAVYCEVGGSPAQMTSCLHGSSVLVVRLKMLDGTRLSDPSGQRVFLAWMDASSELCSMTFHI